MHPSLAALHAYFHTAYPFADPSLDAAFSEFLGNKLAKGPYLSAQLPYASVSESEAEVQALMPTWDNPYPPYHHQFEAFRRLTLADGNVPQPTILTTGTGSGKTESFLYPLLDYCRRCMLDGQRDGIKAIVLYPMNALATDQAKRFAEACYRLARSGTAKVNVGLLIGEGKGHKDERSRAMTPEHVIESRQSILDSPPDILLTNFKMLDYALMRDGLNELWRHNLDKPNLLKYVVLDELHTYDGAQGTDVANLLRRLKLKLEPVGGPAVHFVPVGTSATVGDAADGADKLAAYASKLFGEAIDATAVVGEKRRDIKTFFEPTDDINAVISGLHEPAAYSVNPGEAWDDYLERQRKLWGLPTAQATTANEGNALAKALRQHPLLAEAVQTLVMQRSGAPVALPALRAALTKVDERLAEERFPGWLDSLFALVPLARKSPKEPPLLYLRSQLWLRELSGARLVIAPEPSFVWRDEQRLVPEAPIQATPAFNCRDCGAGGWLVEWMEGVQRLTSVDDSIFREFFSGSKTSWFMLADPDKSYHKPEKAKRLSQHRRWLDAENLTLVEGTGELGPEGSFAVRLVQTLAPDEKKVESRCPCCWSKAGVAIIGGRKALITSVLASELLTRPDLEGGKLLAFSNAVQDAAHVAGFAEARSYRFMLRNAMVQALPEEGAIALDALATQFAVLHHARMDDKHGEAAELAYVATFFPADKEGKVDYHTFLDKRSGNFDRELLNELQLRISWEIIAEFGYRADRGRTLLRTGAAGIQLAEEPLRLVLPEVQRLADASGLGDLAPDATRRFTIGMLHHMRAIGAIDHPFFAQYREFDWTTFMLNWARRKGSPPPRHFLNPGFGSGRYAPKLVTPDASKRGQHIESLSKPASTLLRYFKRAVQSPDSDALVLRFDDRQVANFLGEVLLVFAKAGIVNASTGKPGISYALQPRALEVAHPEASIHCNCCPFTLSTTHLGAEQLHEVTCFRESCIGTLRREELHTQSYYRNLYESPRVQRVFAADHTGMLERDTREALEHDFKQRPQPDSTNLLVATSTLEMGIDIGDLNVVLNTMVPPTTANYLQRIGRAGRATGSAEVLNIAAASKPHDLFYYEDPYEMMAGGIDTPGCYLEARDILRRHFYAYTLDNYSAEPGAAIPDKLAKLALSQAFSPDSFVVRMATYLEANGENLLKQMRDLYVRLDPHNRSLQEGFSEVGDLLASGVLVREWQAAFAKTHDEFVRLSAQLHEINKQHGLLPKGVETQQHVDFQLAKQNLSGSRKRLKQRQVLEHLTNLGILPNYAFPETGVTLEAQVTLPPNQTSQLSLLEAESDRDQVRDKRARKLRRKEFEIVRPARSALREMMPEQSFYTQGYQLPVTSLVIEDFNTQSAEMAFCSRCDHLQEVVDEQQLAEVCPKCSDPSFGSAGNRHRFFRPTGVRAFVHSAKARIRDNKDDRVSTITTNQHHITLPRPRGARILNEVPFGVELNSDVEIRHVNLGPMRPQGPLEIAGTKTSPVGYITCKFCGHATTDTEKEDRDRNRVPKVAADYHLPYCRKRTETYLDVEDDTFAQLFFYSQLSTEALRILLPVSDFHSAEKVALFKSGLLLGIRHHFGGAPSHLEFLDYTEFAGDRAQRFLVLYDKVPGGTGYLNQIFDEATFNQILLCAYEQIKTCRCLNRGKDGCYHCVLSYAFQAPELLSRQKAEELFADICGRLDDWRTLKIGFQQELGATVQVIEESELEEQFVALWRRVAQEPGSHWKFADQLDEAGHRSYRITYSPARELVLSYRLTPQPLFAAGELSEEYTRPDFLIELVVEDCIGTLPEDTRPVVVYLDGYGFHASATHPKFGADVRKRASIASKGAYIPWTLTYDDVKRRLKGFSEEPTLFVPDALADEVGRGEAVRRMRLFAPLDEVANGWLGAEDSFGRLQGLLEAGVSKQASSLAVARMLVLAQGESTALLGQTSTPQELLSQLSGGWAAASTNPPQRTDFWPALLLPTPLVEGWSLRAGVGISSQEVVWRLSAKPDSTGAFNRGAWATSWQVMNVLLLAGLGQEVTVSASAKTPHNDADEGSDNGFTVACFGSLQQLVQEDEVPEPVKATPNIPESIDYAAFEEIAETFPPKSVAGLRRWYAAVTARGWVEGTDYDWGGELVVSGRVLAQAELLSVRHKVAVDVEGKAARETFEKHDFRIFDAVADDPNEQAELWD